LTEEQLVIRGRVATALLSSEDLKWFIDHYKSLILESITQTKPEQTEERERLYYQFKAVDDLIGIMASYSDAASAITHRQEKETD